MAEKPTHISYFAVFPSWQPRQIRQVKHSSFLQVYEPDFNYRLGHLISNYLKTGHPLSLRNRPTELIQSNLGHSRRVQIEDLHEILCE